MYTFFYSNISEFAGNLGGMLDEVKYRTTIHNIHTFGWKAKYFKSSDVSMLGHGCGVSQYPQFYDKIKNKSNFTTSICGNMFRWKGSPILAQTMDSCISQISWNVYYGFNKWHANYKILTKFGKYYG